MPIRLPALPADPTAAFPPPETALREPDGLLAMGGDLSPARLLNAYAQGVFPWYAEGQPLLWWSPDPRMVFRTGRVRLSSRFRRSLRRCEWTVTADTCFQDVITACADAPRAGQPGTWITSEMQAAYTQLHRLGHAHSIEVRTGARLVGGLYGIAIGRMFFGESMVSLASGGSKVAIAALAHRLEGWGFPLIDAQVENPHLLSLGAESWPRERFLQAVHELCAQPGMTGCWSNAFGQLHAADLAAADGNRRDG
ncbi:leucyl/phenylalanyl-tRNA--protein transferase [Novilysobacter spongiicola]|uniref:Leucyl/phenylalanyl-tRNA--protein transferase n=1 Tax=Lysobacter spongiicola DSM 21749 TaxID=1122188 RepID=A0A1T4M808_9GAMM|nr:leucyl/phenylalanyl-tRNA--protein transferase [Lysobacter spongiicola]SJZ63170.1 leucyl/phenylalanyl-tRNA--protein transferase [Lysobacter spongiicola DSM 21749]